MENYYTSPSLAFIIPSLNEADKIGKTLSSIKNAISHTNFEIVVCDNGSTDNTREIAEKNGAKVLLDEKATIGGLRNLGVKSTKGEILVFIDADVALAPDWYREFIKYKDTLSSKKLFITGSVCSVPPNPSFIELYWFDKLSRQPKEYINSGHLITTRKLFEIVGGFDDSLKTAEDYDFCQRAKRMNIILAPNENLTAYHYGYPKSLLSFFRREVWHGKSDVKSLGMLIKSKTALVAIANSLSLIIASTLLIFDIKAIAIYASMISALISTASVTAKFKTKNPKDFIIQLLLIEAYFAARTAAIFIKTPQSSKKDRV